mmetsp:Transcript_6418/g.10896  ORF Transcript_6418/g.10896 Transcript_6418/m.10896 type:complete len:172 (+) Transcript_6418:442-957(+)
MHAQTQRFRDDSKADNDLFKDCLKTLQVAIDLLSEESVQGFMTKFKNQPLRTIIQRLVDSQQRDVEEAIAILQFLNTYAQQLRGSLHLHSENILAHIQKNKQVQQVFSRGFYEQEARDQHHILWCKVLTLLRTLNQNLIDEDLPDLAAQNGEGYLQSFDPQSYIRQLLGFL